MGINTQHSMRNALYYTKMNYVGLQSVPHDNLKTL